MTDTPHHLTLKTPAAWVVRFAPLVAAGGPVLDVAAGGGRHGRHFLDRGHPVTFADMNVSALADLARNDSAEVVAVDLEDGFPWPFPAGAFAGIVVTNYLFRPHLAGMIGSLAPGGVLIYETFAKGNEAFGRPRNPDHLLRPGELLDLVQGRLQVVAFEQGVVGDPPPGVKQRLCAVNDAAPHPLGPDSPPIP